MAPARPESRAPQPLMRIAGQRPQTHPAHPRPQGTHTHSYTFYPYITSGCAASENDVDFDSESTSNAGSVKFTSPSGNFIQTDASSELSTNAAWARNPISGWSSDNDSIDYGIWTT